MHLNVICSVDVDADYKSNIDEKCYISIQNQNEKLLDPVKGTPNTLNELVQLTYQGQIPQMSGSLTLLFFDFPFLI